MPSVSDYCSTPAPDWSTFRQKYNEEFWRNALAKDSGETLYIDTRWVVLYNSNEQKIPIERVQDCLKMLNTIFSGQNTEELDQVPNTAQNPWKDRVGNPNIQFLPLDSSTLQVEYVPISSTLSTSSPVSDAAQRAGRVDGVLNLYISTSGGGNILGQAELNSNIAYGLYSAIGGYEVSGTLSNYDKGKTMAHEVGHALGLVHTFSDTACDGFSPFTDVPEQIRPNFDTVLFTNNQGQPDQKGDNRWKDRLNGTALSCLNFQDDPSSAPNEMGINIMDYGNDDVSIVFTKNQALMMRTYLQSDENTTLQLKTADGVSISAGGGGSGSGVSTDASTESDDSSGLSTGAIIGIVVGVVVLIIILIVVFHYRNKKKYSRTMTSTAYYIPPMKFV